MSLRSSSILDFPYLVISGSEDFCGTERQSVKILCRGTLWYDTNLYTFLPINIGKKSEHVDLHLYNVG